MTYSQVHHNLAGHMKVILYTKSHCGYCVRAKNLLDQLGVEFESINLDGKHDELVELVKKSGMRTLPQIYIGDKLIGGYTELAAMDRSGELSQLLG